jgi:hypothetical protein
LTPNQVPLNLPLLKIDGLKIIIDWKNSLLSLTSLHETEEKG